MKFAKLFVVAAVATVVFASCGGGASTENADSTAVAVDTAVVVAADTTTVVADTTATDSAAVAQ